MMEILKGEWHNYCLPFIRKAWYLSLNGYSMWKKQHVNGGGSGFKVLMLK